MPMNNLDLNLNEEELRSQFAEALQGDNEGAIVDTFVRMANGIEKNILKEARSIAANEANDRMILQGRGQYQLTTEERNYYKEVIEKRGFTNLSITMPKSIYERVFEYLENNHELLSEIDFNNATGVSEWIIRTTDVAGAAWGKLDSTIVKELEANFDTEQVGMYKLSAFIPVSKDMLLLGAEWIDKYVRAILSESIAIALELAIVAGTGKDQPIGMLKDLEGSVLSGVYSDKSAKALTDFTPTTLGKEIMAPLSRNGKRAVSKVLMIVNPLDYWQKLFGATTVLASNGAYITGVLPIPGRIIQSVAVPAGKMVAGVGSDYMALLGSASKIEYSDEYKFLEDQRVYAVKMHANAKPKDNESFLVFDITNTAVRNAEMIQQVNYEAGLPKTITEDIAKVVAAEVAKVMALSQAEPFEVELEDKKSKRK